MGALGTGGGDPSYSKVSEVIYFDTVLSDVQISQVTHYLAKKWGLTTVADSDGDGVSDADELSGGSGVTDADSIPLPDLSESFDALMADDSGINAIEVTLPYGWIPIILIEKITQP